MIVVNKAPFYHDGNFIAAAQETITADPSTGYWEASLVETASVGKTYDFTVQSRAAGAKAQKLAGVIVPNQDSAAFNSIATIT